jgi:hypothetical protein
MGEQFRLLVEAFGRAVGRPLSKLQYPCRAHDILLGALRRNAVFMSDVTQRSLVPRWVMMASHMATSAAPMIVMPLTMPPGRRSRHCARSAVSHGSKETLQIFWPGSAATKLAPADKQVCIAEFMRFPDQRSAARIIPRADNSDEKMMTGVSAGGVGGLSASCTTGNKKEDGLVAAQK